MLTHSPSGDPYSLQDSNTALSLSTLSSATTGNGCDGCYIVGAFTNTTIINPSMQVTPTTDNAFMFGPAGIIPVT